VAGFLSRRRECRKATGAAFVLATEARESAYDIVHCDSQFAECGRFVDRTAKDLVRAAPRTGKIRKEYCKHWIFETGKSTGRAALLVVFSI